MRNKSLTWMVIGSMVAVSLIIGACAPTAPAPTGKPLTIAGGSIGGTSQLWSSAVGGVLHKYLGNYATVISYQYMGIPNLLQDESVDIGFSSAPFMAFALTGTGPYEETGPHKDLRTLFWVNVCPLQIAVSVDSKVRTLEDALKVKFNMGTPGSDVVMLFGKILDALNLSEEGLDYVQQGHREAAAGMQAGKIEVFWATSSLPHPTLAELDLTFPIRLLELTDEQLRAVKEKYPAHIIMQIPPTFHTGKPIWTLALANGAVTTTRLSEEIAYQLTKSFLENPTFVGYYEAALEDFIREGSAKKFAEETAGVFPYHAGAYRYYKEVGWKIPASMIPPEAE